MAPIEHAVITSLFKWGVTVYRDPDGRPVIELPTPEATYEPHVLTSERARAGIAHFYYIHSGRQIVLTEAEIRRVILILEGFAYEKSPPPQPTPLDPLDEWDPLVHIIARFLTEHYETHQRLDYDETPMMRFMTTAVVPTAKKLGISLHNVPWGRDSASLGTRIRRIEDKLLRINIEPTFAARNYAKTIALKWMTAPVLATTVTPPSPSPSPPTPSSGKGLVRSDGGYGSDGDQPRDFSRIQAPPSGDEKS